MLENGLRHSALFSRVLDEFDRAWQSGQPPDIENFLTDDAARREILIELVMVDLERRWRSASRLQTLSLAPADGASPPLPVFPRLEDYVERYPDLGEMDRLPVELIAEEFRVRHKWGDRPSLDEYSQRFSHLGDQLQERLQELAQVIESSAKDRTAKSSLPVDAADPAAPHPSRLGRYRVEKPLGKGSFGIVYLARDEQLDRLVAIKVPHARLVSRAEDAQAYVSEAQTVARLDHPHIVPVYDVGSTDGYPCYVVSKYVEGIDLGTRLRQQRPSYLESAELIATLADALHYAHKQGLVHRDVKPANVLIGTDGKPYVVDFGLALREEDIGKGPRFAGSPAYMSPEQARGEGHRVDGRSDVFSLGSVFYELLTGRTAFSRRHGSDVLEQIVLHEPRPPRQLDDVIPKELERICLKALSKRATERYTTAMDMAEDLRHFLSAYHEGASDGSDSEVTNRVSRRGGSVDAEHRSLPSDRSSLGTSTSKAQADSTQVPGQSDTVDSTLGRIVPKGLRSFDRHDADFFLELLPAPRDREGLPDSIRFWKTRIEETESENTFSTGLIYGPSGCGKSSLVKAGLLPRLSNHVFTIYMEAGPADTETRLLSALRKRFPLPADLSLKDSLAMLRKERDALANRKLLIVLDQFEQWLHANSGKHPTELAQALRQCDGGNVQCLLLLRDDFWMAVTRFFKELEVRLLEDHNLAAIDLFPERHARKVLAAYGRAFGALPENGRETTEEQKEFLRQSVSGLAEEEKVICVRLALLAEMMKDKEWTPATLKKVGGPHGVGVAFLEDTFSSPTASPEHRFHQRAAREVLHALLPESGTEIKGQMKSHADLLQASGYASRRQDFDELMSILDSGIRLVTPSDPEGVKAEGASLPNFESEQKYYQLTHDYMVPALREWLTRKQRETRRGRAQLKLRERADLWSVKRENRHLPSLLEWATISFFTADRTWTLLQRQMMRKAAKRYRFQAFVAIVLLVAAIAGGRAAQNTLHVRQQEMLARQQVERNQAEASRLVEGLLQAETIQVSGIIAELAKYRQWAADDLIDAFRTPRDDLPNAKLHAALAMLPVDKSVLDFLADRLLTTPSDQFAPVRDLMYSHKDALVEYYWTVAKDTQEISSRRFQAACVLATYDPDETFWADDDFADLLARHLVNVLPTDLLYWREALRPVHHHLTDFLVAIYRESQRGDKSSIASDILAEYLGNKPDELFELLLEADQNQFRYIFDRLSRHRDRAVELGNAEIARTAPQTASEEEIELLALGKANAAVMLLKMRASDQVWPLLRHSPDPRVRSYVIHQLGPRSVDPRTIVARFQGETDASVRSALLLCLGEFDETQLTASERQQLFGPLLDVYRSDPHAGVHSAAEWLLAKWGQGAQLRAVNSELRRIDDPLRTAEAAGRRWYINGQGRTFAIFYADRFQMGSPPSERPDRDNETLHWRRLGRKFAVSTKEVTRAEWREFSQAAREAAGSADPERQAPTDRLPIVGVSWYEAAWFCNWLSGKEGIPQEQWCYEPNSEGKYGPGMSVKEDFLELNGYRLPTEAEWEYACRAGATTSRSFGQTEALLPRYAWYPANSEGHVWPVGSLKPNEFGLFDVYGNVWEWCHDEVQQYPTDPDAASDDEPRAGLIPESRRRIIRGGAFVTQPLWIRSAFRGDAFEPVEALPYFGFRPARTCEPTQPVNTK